YYHLKNFNAGGFSTYSNEQSAITTLNSPTALTATTVSSSQINLTWTDNSSSESGYKIEQSPVDNLHYTQIATVGPNQTSYSATGTYADIGTVGPNATTYVDSDSALLDGTRYYYKVCATNVAGNSPFSNEVNGITLLKTPTGLSATAVSSSQINLTWTDNSLAESGYRIEQSPVDDLHFVEIYVTGPNRSE